MDESLARLANGACGRWDWLDALMHALDSGRPFFAFVACLLFLPLARAKGEARRAWLVAILAVLIGVASGAAAGRLLAGALPPRPRPLEALDLNLPRGVSPATLRAAMLCGRPDTSTPSTHAITGAGVGLCLVWFRPILGVLAALLGGLLMVAPILHFGLHWPTDLLASLGIAGCAGWCAARLRTGLSAPASFADAALRRWPALSAVALSLISVLVVWRAHPRTGILDAMTRAVRSLAGAF